MVLWVVLDPIRDLLGLRRGSLERAEACGDGLVAGPVSVHRARQIL